MALKVSRSTLNKFALPFSVGVLAVAARHNLLEWRRQLPEARDAKDSPINEPWPATPRVSALVAAWNEAEHVQRHIRSFKALDYPGKQLVLCAGGDDGTFELANELADDDVVVLEQLAREGKQHALQRCLEASDGQVVMLTDADCLFGADAFRRLIEPIARGDTYVTTGYWKPLPDQESNFFARFQWFASAGAERARQGVYGVHGANCALSRGPAERLRIFHAPAATGTDYVLGRLLASAEYPITMVNDSLIEARFPTNPASYLRSWRRWIKNILIHGPRYGDRSGTTQTVIAISLAAGIVITPLAAPLVGRTAVLLPFTALSIATMNRIRRVALGAVVNKSPAWPTVAMAPAFALLDQVAALLSVYDLFSRESRHRW